MPAPSTRFPTCCRWLERVCLFFALLGALLPFAYFTPIFALYRTELARVVDDASLTDHGPTLKLLLGITGGSIAGKWLLHWAIVHHGVRARQRWAARATLAGLLSWLVIDSIASLAAGAWANVVFVNVMPPLLVLPLLALVWKDCDQDLAPIPSAPRVATIAMGIGALSGLVIAFGMSTPIFAAWWRGLGDAHFAGSPPPATARTLVHYFAGPIGGATFGQFVLALYAIRYGQAWGWRWTLLSIVTWATIDSAYSLAHGAAFNVLLVNVPCVVLLGGALLLAKALQK